MGIFRNAGCVTNAILLREGKEGIATSTYQDMAGCVHCRGESARLCKDETSFAVHRQNGAFGCEARESGDTSARNVSALSEDYAGGYGLDIAAAYNVVPVSWPRPGSGPPLSQPLFCAVDITWFVVVVNPTKVRL